METNVIDEKVVMHVIISEIRNGHVMHVYACNIFITCVTRSYFALHALHAITWYFMWTFRPPPPLFSHPCALTSLFHAANMLNTHEDLRARPSTWMGYEMVVKGIKHSDIQVMSCRHLIFYMHLHNLTCNQNCYIHYMSISIFTSIYMTITYSCSLHGM